MPDQKNFAAIFSSTKSGSDVEDIGPGIAPKQIIPVWQSQDFTDCVKILDRAILQSSTTSQYKKAMLRLTGRTGEKTEQHWELTNVPQHLPCNCYSQSFRNSCSELEKSQLNMDQELPLDQIKAILDLKTRKTLPCSSGESSGAPQRPPRSPLRDGFSMIQGSSKNITPTKQSKS